MWIFLLKTLNSANSNSFDFISFSACPHGKQFLHAVWQWKGHNCEKLTHFQVGSWCKHTCVSFLTGVTHCWSLPTAFSVPVLIDLGYHTHITSFWGRGYKRRLHCCQGRAVCQVPQPLHYCWRNQKFKKPVTGGHWSVLRIKTTMTNIQNANRRVPNAHVARRRWCIPGQSSERLGVRPVSPMCPACCHSHAMVPCKWVWAHPLVGQRI